MITEAQRATTPLSPRAEGFSCSVGTDLWEDDQSTGEAIGGLEEELCFH